jgi:radical SAM superfamily enzyme YgiQ (UPF0313 family)
MARATAKMAEEIGAIRKDHGGRLRIALLYPNTYAVGMSNLGFQTLYRLFNARDDVVCERAFLPDAPGPLRTLESGTLLAEMDVVAFSIAFELDAPHLPALLRLGGIEPFAAERDGPLVLAGGAVVAYNPEPIAPFLDAAVVGEAEEIVDPLVEALLDVDPRAALAALPGVYLPERGTQPVARLLVDDLDAVPVHTQVFTPQTEFGDMALIEVGRGCPYGCRFCVARHIYRPLRWRSLAALLPVIDHDMAFRRRIGLIGAAVTDHPEILDLCDAILSRGGEPAPASMRADALTPELLALLARGRVRTITLAPEAGTEALRRAVGKRLPDDVLLAAAARAKTVGISNVKLYFIVGLPGETDDDVRAIPDLAVRLAREAGVRVTVGCSTFVPKPGTPFALRGMVPPEEATRRLALVRAGLRGRADFTQESPRLAYWQGVLARGGREQAAALDRIGLNAKPAVWDAAFRDAGLAPDAILRDLPSDAPLPWAHIGATRCTFRDPAGDWREDGETA